MIKREQKQNSFCSLWLIGRSILSLNYLSSFEFLSVHCWFGFFSISEGIYEKNAHKYTDVNKINYRLRSVRISYWVFTILRWQFHLIRHGDRYCEPATTGGKVGNCKKLKLNKNKVTLKRKKTFKLKAEVCNIRWGLGALLKRPSHFLRREF